MNRSGNMQGQDQFDLVINYIVMVGREMRQGDMQTRTSQTFSWSTRWIEVIFVFILQCRNQRKGHSSCLSVS